MPRRPIRIGLVLGHSLSFYRQILRGVKAFATERPEWVFTPIAPNRRALRQAGPLHCSGYIAHIFNRPLATALRRLRRPVVNVSGVLSQLPFPHVVADHRAVGRLAGQHLLDRGFRHLGFMGYPAHEFSVEREAGLRESAHEVGIAVHIFFERTARADDPTGFWKANRPLQDWLRRLPKPIGVLASHDTQAAQICEDCRQLGLKVPDDVAIVGVDDDDLLCELARPPLSSVALPGERIGYEAAQLLDRWLHGDNPRQQSIVLPPAGLVVRQSSNLLAVPDRHVAEAVQFIHAHASEPIKVSDVLRIVPVARRALERRFRRWLQRSILDEIHRVHRERAQRLLEATDLGMAEVAARAGYRDSRQLSIAFRRDLDMTPSDYRRRLRMRP